MKTFYKILCACLACLCVVIYAGQTDRVTELETERDIIDVAVDTHKEALAWPKVGKHRVYILQEAK